MELVNTIQKIQQEFDENINSHVFLVETNDYEKCLIDIKNVVKKIVKSNDKSIDEQIEQENYLEQIIIRPEGKDIKKDQIAELQNRLKTKPILSDSIIYIIIGADLMNDTVSNKLLKTIEEPSENIIGFLLTSNIDIILPTIKSRCEILSAKYDSLAKENEESFEIDDTAIKLINLIENNNLLEFNILKMDNKTIKDSGKLVVNKIKDYYNNACSIANNSKLDTNTVELIKSNSDYKTLIKKAKYLNKTLNKLTLNMNIDLLLEKIFIELKECDSNESSRNKV